MPIAVHRYSSWLTKLVLGLLLVGGLLGKMLFASEAMFMHQVTIKKPIDDVWGALVSKQIVDSYYFVPISGDITEAGQDFSYGVGGQAMITASVLEIEKPTVLRHSFRFAGDGQPDSVVTYELKPSGDATVVTVKHSGYEEDSQPYADIAGGWPVILGNLKSTLEQN